MGAGHIGMAQPLSLPHAAFQQLFGPWRQLNGRLQAGALADKNIDGRAHRVLRQAFGQVGHVVPRLADQSQQDMFRTHIGMAHGLGFLLCHSDDTLGPFIEFCVNCHLVSSMIHELPHAARPLHVGMQA